MNILAQDQALLNLELYLATPEAQALPIPPVLSVLPAHAHVLPPPPPPPPPPTSAPKSTKLDSKEAIFNTNVVKKRYSEDVAQNKKESEKRPKLAQVAQVISNTQVVSNAQEQPQERIFTIIFSNNKNMIQFPATKYTEKIEKKFIFHLRDGISTFKDHENSLDKAFDKAFDKATTFLNFIMNMNIKPTVLTIGTNDDLVTDTTGLYITCDFFGSNETLYTYNFLKMTNIDTFERHVIFEIKNDIAIHACIFAKNIQSLVNFAESDSGKARDDLCRAQEKATKAKHDFNTAQEKATKAKHDLKTADENARKAMNKSDFDIAQKNVITAQKNVIIAQENVITAQEKSAAAQKNVTTAHQKLTTAQADTTLTKEKALYAANDAEKKTKDASYAENNTKDKEKINLPIPKRIILFKY